MAPRNGFGRSLLFAASVATALPVATTFAAPLFGGATTVRLYAIAAAVLYTCGLAAGRSARVAAFALAGLAGTLVALGSTDLAHAALGAAAIVACGRIVLCGGAHPLRAAAIEAGLGATGLGVAWLLARGDLLSLCLALWGYFLVQSAYFLISGRPVRSEATDPFERARTRLERLLREEIDLPR